MSMERSRCCALMKPRIFACAREVRTKLSQSLLGRALGLVRISTESPFFSL